jgi:hypothetical protein
VVKLKYASKEEGFRGSRRVDTNEVQAIPFLCETVDFFVRGREEKHTVLFFSNLHGQYERINFARLNRLVPLILNCKGS